MPYQPSLRLRKKVQGVVLSTVLCLPGCTSEADRQADDSAESKVNVALDEIKPTTEREAAVADLKHDKRLRSLENLVPGHSDVVTLDAVSALQDVGDVQSADFLEAVLHSKVELPGKINAEIEAAIKEINARNDSK